MPSIGTTCVSEIMSTHLVTVQESDSMEHVANVFKEHDINAAPVVDQNQKCVGIITSTDLVDYESVRKAMHSEMKYGSVYDVAHYRSGEEARAMGAQFDDVGFHMTTQLQTVSLETPLSKVASDMCTYHRHHVLVLDDSEKPLGIVSSLDILGFMIGVPVCRSTKIPNV